MKKLLSLFVLASLLLTVGMVSAKVGDPDTECKAKGFDYGIVKYECNSIIPVEGSAAEDYEISYINWNLNNEGKCSSVDWTSNPDADGVLSKEGKKYFISEDLGTLSKTGKNSISHITFCGNYNDEPVVPEFGAIVATLTVIGALGAFFIVRKK